MNIHQARHALHPLRQRALPCGLIILFGGRGAIQTHAATAVKDDLGFSMPCDQVLKLGRDKFEDVYTTRTHNSSTMGMNRGYDYYMNCRRADNEQRARPLTNMQRQQINILHEALRHLNTALYEIETQRAGGGTMYRVFATANAAGHEDLVGEVIKVLSHPARQNPALRRRTAHRFAQAQSTLKHLAAPPSSGDPADTPVEQKRSYAHAYMETQQALSSLRAIASELSAAAAWRVANHLHNEIENALDAD